MQLYYLNELEGHDRYVDKSLCLTNWWTEKETKLVMKWIYDCGGYDKVEVRNKAKYIFQHLFVDPCCIRHYFLITLYLGEAEEH